MPNRQPSFFIALFVALLLSACAARQVSRDSDTAGDANTGVVAFAVTHDLGVQSGHNAIVYLDDGPISGGWAYQSYESPLPLYTRGSDYSDAVGYLYVISLPAGRHEFTSWQITDGGGLRIYPKKPVQRLAFDVKPGEIQYVGAFHAHVQQGRNMFGWMATHNGFIVTTDKSARDLSLLLKRYPKLQGKVATTVVHAGVWGKVNDASTILESPLPIPVPTNIK